MSINFHPAENLDAADKLIIRIDHLHSAPQIAQRILVITRNPDFSMREVAECLENDPALAAKILRVVNSSRYGLRHKVTNLRQAASYLGQRSLRLITLTFGLVETLTRGNAGQFYTNYWRRTLTTATVASHLSNFHREIRKDDAYTAGLLADVGMLVLAQFHTEEYLALCESTAHGRDLLDAEREKFGFSHAALGARLLQLWDLPDPLVEAVAGHHQVSTCSMPLENAVRAGSLMADALWVRNSPSVLTAKTLMQQDFGLDTDGFIDLAVSCQHDISENAEMFGVQLGESFDCQQLIQEAMRMYSDASLEAALELDSLVAAFDDLSS